MERQMFIGGYDQATWTTSTQDLRVDNGPLAVEMMVVAWDVANTTATATTTANTLAALNPLKVTHEAKKIAEIRGDDLYALNVLWLENNPITIVATAATSAVTRVNALRLPINSKAGATVSTLATKATITNGGAERLSLSAICEEKGEDTHFEILTTSYTPAGAGTFMLAYNKLSEGDVVGYLIFSTTIATATADTISADKLRIKVNGNQIKDTNWDLMLGLSHDGYHPLFADPGTEAILDNYVWVPFIKEHPVKGDEISLEINAGDTSAIRIVEVVKVAN